MSDAQKYIPGLGTAFKFDSKDLNIFVSTEQVATGLSQNIAHGLGVAPSAVLVIPTDTSPAAAGVFTVTEGLHDATNAIVTVTSGKKFKVLVLA